MLVTLSSSISQSMLGEVGTDLLHHSQSQFLRQLLQLLLAEEHLHLVLLRVSQDILHHQFFCLVAVLEVGELAVETVDAVVVDVLEKFLEDGGNFRVDGFLFLILLGGIGLAGLLDELFVLLLEDDPLAVGGLEVVVGADDHPLDQVLLQPIQAQKFGNGGIDLDVDWEDLFEGAAGVDGDGGDDALEELGDIQDVDPVGGVLVGDEDVEGEELVVGRVVDALLDHLRTALHRLRVTGRPVPAEVLAVDGELQHLRVAVADVGEHFGQAVVELRDEIARIVEAFVEVLSGVGAGDGDVAGEEVSPAAVAYKLSVVVDGEVRAVDFLRGGPEDVGCIVAEFADAADELGPGGVLQGGVLLEDETLLEDIDYFLLLFLHRNSFIYDGQI